MFVFVTETIDDLPSDDKHLVYRWEGPGEIYFSVCKQGSAVSCHFKSDKKGLRYLKRAINDFCCFCFYMFDWCEMVLAKIGRKSIGRLISKCGFELLVEYDNASAYARKRP